MLVLTNKNQYEMVIEALRKTSGDPSQISTEIKQQLSLAAFQCTAAYDAAVSSELDRRQIEKNTQSPTFCI